MSKKSDKYLTIASFVCAIVLNIIRYAIMFYEFRKNKC